ncbi:MAG: AAA family ATPase [Pseudomonadota bacterium]
MKPLRSLGPRIVILGPSNAGKSTLAVAISEKPGVEAVFLDQLRHIPNTDWQIKPDADFATLHDAAIAKDAWVMDGNYSSLFEPRLARATGIIFLRSNRWLRFYRYLIRTLFAGTQRAGGLEGGRDSLKWEMIDWVLFKSKKSSDRYLKVLHTSDLPLVEIHSAKHLKAVYAAWGLSAKI